MAIKRDIAEKLMGEKGNLVSPSFSVIPDVYVAEIEAFSIQRSVLDVSPSTTIAQAAPFSSPDPRLRISESASSVSLSSMTMKAELRLFLEEGGAVAVWSRIASITSRSTGLSLKLRTLCRAAMTFENSISLMI